MIKAKDVWQFERESKQFKKDPDSYLHRKFCSMMDKHVELGHNIPKGIVLDYFKRGMCKWAIKYFDGIMTVEEVRRITPNKYKDTKRV